MRKTDTIVRGQDPGPLMVCDVMENDVMTCHLHTSTDQIARLMLTHGFGSVPVVNDDEWLVGIVSEYDLLQLMIDGRDLKKINAAEVMTPDVVTITEHMSVRSLATLFQDRHVIRLPVVRDQRLVGMVARRDLVFGDLKAQEQWS